LGHGYKKTEQADPGRIPVFLDSLLYTTTPVLAPRCAGRPSRDPNAAPPPRDVPPKYPENVILYVNLHMNPRSPGTREARPSAWAAGVAPAVGRRVCRRIGLGDRAESKAKTTQTKGQRNSREQSCCESPGPISHGSGALRGPGEFVRKYIAVGVVGISDHPGEAPDPTTALASLLTKQGDPEGTAGWVLDHADRLQSAAPEPRSKCGL